MQLSKVPFLCVRLQPSLEKLRGLFGGPVSEGPKRQLNEQILHVSNPSLEPVGKP